MAKDSHNRFGGWVFDPSELTLTWERYGYTIDLEQVTTCAEMLDWIFQINGKGWGEGETSSLVEAFDELFHPQATLCSGGSELGPINPAPLLRRTTRW